MAECTYVVDPDGDVILTLYNPDAPFAALPQDERRRSDILPLADLQTPQPTTTSKQPTVASTGGEPKEIKQESPAITASQNAELTTVGRADHCQNANASVGNATSKSESSPSSITQPPTNSEPGMEHALSALVLSDDPSKEAPAAASYQDFVSKRKVTIRLSAAHLMLASPVFREWIEEDHRENPNQLCLESFLAAIGWDVEAFLIVMHIIHGRTRGVPRSVNIELLAKIALIVDHYQCHEAVDLVVSLWFTQLRCRLPINNGRDRVLWLLVAWVFHQEALFEAIATMAVNDITKPFSALGLEVLEPIAEMINIKRQHWVLSIVLDLLKLQQGLRDGQIGCSFECSSMLLGALTIESTRLKLLVTNTDFLLNNQSVDSIVTNVQGIRSPQWQRLGGFASPGPRSRCLCDLHSIIQLMVAKLPNRTAKLGDLSDSGRSNQSDDWAPSSVITLDFYIGEPDLPARPVVYDDPEVSKIPSTIEASGFYDDNAHDRIDRLLSINAQPKFKDHSPEELRLGDYARHSQLYFNLLRKS
ncbi:uncharacterized protein B0I36DRAFT_331620 [Microdochium trichocladiopsis]|uniref:BTB domain-containing protein n=1 Tax=Microdochium trichocladiopsis TaxID=1682393 RepID=A0A9P8XXD4_9PEZI|nr:uncharacterized protein B0I36DRAFT_331620 [Microdochium trichocladiopsis]KAH7024557.1 hypothetical protein B0I36DRAFT_331620 [Microdochium trichocladiopsis]